MPLRFLSKDAPPDGWIEIGRIGRPHGVQGALHLRLHNDDSELIAPGLHIGIWLGSKWSEVEVVDVGGGGAVTLTDVEGREGADAIKHAIVYVERDAFPPLDDDEVYLTDLEGAEVIDEAGGRFGVVEGFDDNGAQPLMQVRTDDHRLIDVPFVGALVLDIAHPQTAEGHAVITLRPPSGLFDDESALVSGDKPNVPRSPKGRAKKRQAEARAAAEKEPQS